VQARFLFLYGLSLGPEGVTAEGVFVVKWRSKDAAMGVGVLDFATHITIEHRRAQSFI